MLPPEDVPSAPPKSSTFSTAMPLAMMDALSCAAAMPGLPEASAGAGSGSPSVWATSSLGIRQPGHGNVALVAEGDTSVARIRGAHYYAF
jgi:hypothetical protein